MLCPKKDLLGIVCYAVRSVDAYTDDLHWHAGNLVALNFTAMNLTCTLPSAQLSQFTALQSLSLSNNPNLQVSKAVNPSTW